MMFDFVIDTWTDFWHYSEAEHMENFWKIVAY